MKQKLFVIILLFFVICSHATAEFIVHTIYFQPVGAPPIAEMEKRISDYSLLSQNFYMNEMNRHGFGEKTYRLENTDAGTVRIHLVKGNRDVNYYLTDTVNRVFAELPNQFNPDTAPWHKQDTIRVIVVGGIRHINNWAVGVGWPRHSGRYGGSCVLAGGSPQFNQHYIAHEIGHCFGLYHREGCDLCLMGPGNTELAHYEARWLDKHYHFNAIVNNFTFPKPMDNTLILKNIGDDDIQFQLDVQSDIGLHQAMLFRQHDITVIGFDYLNGKNRDVIIIDAKRHRWANIVLQIMDTRGNHIMKEYTIIKPHLDELKKQKNPDTIVDREETKEDIDLDPNNSIGVELRTSSKNKLTTSWGSLKRRR